MLYRQLKAIVEADEPKLDDEGNPIEEPKEKPKKTKKQKDFEKTTSDGVGNYNDDMMKQISSSLRANSSTIKFADVSAANNTITLILKKKSTLEEMNEMKPRIILLISAEMAGEFNVYDLGEDIMIDEKTQSFLFKVVKKEEKKA